MIRLVGGPPNTGNFKVYKDDIYIGDVGWAGFFSWTMRPANNAPIPYGQNKTRDDADEGIG